MELPIKKLQLDQEDYSTVLSDVVAKYTARVIKQNELISSGYLDSPYLPAAISLGPENKSRSPIYKINAPGYFYRQRYRGTWNSETIAGVLVSDSPTNMSVQSKRMVYLAGSDSTIGHANNMYPILPGSKTYVYIVRNTTMPNNSVRNEWLFVPTVLSASLNIRPEDFVSEVGVPSIGYTLTGSASLETIKSSFTGDWTKNFKSVCGWNVSSESAAISEGTGEITQNGMTFLDDASKAEFIMNRRTWITGLGATPSDYGY